MTLKVLGINFAGEDKVFDDVIGRSHPCFQFLQSGVVERVADGADGLDSVKRFPNDARQEGRGSRRRQS